MSWIVVPFLSLGDSLLELELDRWSYVALETLLIHCE